MSHIKTELSPEVMADEILSVFRINNIKPNGFIDASILLLSFRSKINGIQSGMD